MSRFLLLGVLLVLAAGPLLAPALPAGPAGLLRPSAVAVAAAVAVLLFVVFAWPWLSRERKPRRVLGEGGEILAVSLPVVLVLARSSGATRLESATALAVLAGAAIVTGLWLVGPGAGRERDRWFAAVAVLLLVGLPFANFALNEFGVTTTDFAYRVSPLLVVRGILLGEPGAGPLPCLLSMLGLASLLSGLRVVRLGTVAALTVMVSAAPARSGELEPQFGGFYVPGRPVPLGVEEESGAREVAVRSGADWTTIALEPGRRRWVEVPGRESLREVRVRGGEGEEILDAGVRPVAPGTWLVAVGPAPAGLLRAAADRGFHVGRAATGALGISDEAWLSVDGVIDVGERLGRARTERLRGAGIPVIRRVEDLPARAPVPRGTRRPWEEAGNILGADGLADLFPPAAEYDEGDAVAALLLCVGWAVVAGALLRWGRGRTRGRGILLSLAALLILSDLLVESEARPESGQLFRVVEGNRVIEITLFRGDRLQAAAGMVGEALPQPLFDGASIEAGEAYRLAFRLKPGERRMFVLTRFAAGPVQDPGPDVLIGPAGLAEPGQEWLPAGEFLRRLPTQDRARAAAIRKLLSVGRLPDRVYQVAFTPDGMDVRPMH